GRASLPSAAPTSSPHRRSSTRRSCRPIAPRRRSCGTRRCPSASPSPAWPSVSDARGRADGLVAAALAVGALAFFYVRSVRIAAYWVGYEASDLFLYFYPSQTFEATRLRAGALPFWNPWQGAGQPFLATLQPGALYPGRLLLLALDARPAL